ncbi:hypothetical protein N7495_002692 [Penicillium taxi]|uniref:uncharacterized protein n=1 Tax=Penicillium taxi TaxID=168475 RepID=UPI0025456578|nr:uncharacterized protein N7495_002692 [Penicillium taxi]KAJ5902164.1 hypothetical protein N7495_002692 [Penicillium taxi]
MPENDEKQPSAESISRDQPLQLQLVPEPESSCCPKGESEPVLDPSESLYAPAYSIFGKYEKWFLVGMAAVTGLFSPLPANIYFPALVTLAKVFDRSTEELNLTVTVYLVMQGVSPMLWGPLSDRLGRRPIFLVCLFILIGSSIGLALCPTSAFWLLLLMRIFQAGGCASTIALGAGVIGDIATNEERGGYFGMFNLGPMLAPCIGPAIGGALSQHLGWRSIFWFLTAFSVVCFILVLLFLPETMRGLVGNGSISPKGAIYRPLVPIIGQRAARSKPEMKSEKPQAKQGSMNPFRLLTYPDILLTLTYTGIVYAVNYTITATISSSFAKVYPFLSETNIGLCYLTTGAGMILGSTITGKMLDRDYAKIKAAYLDNREKSLQDSTQDEDFPVEYARLRTMPIHLFLFVGCAIAWGWCIERKLSIAGPLILQVVLGWTSISILNATMTLMIDIVKKQSSGVIACTNLVRCSLAAVLVSVIDKSTDRLGYGWTYVLLAAICLLLLPLILMEMRLGPGFRRKRGGCDILR